MGVSRFSPLLTVSTGSGPARKLGKTGRKISSEYRQDRTTGVREMTKNVFVKLFLIYFLKSNFQAAFWRVFGRRLRC